MSEVVYVTEGDLQAVIDRVLAQYPWFADYPVTCHAKCARWDIARDRGSDAGNAWDRYDNALWMLTGNRAGKEVAR